MRLIDSDADLTERGTLPTLSQGKELYNIATKSKGKGTYSKTDLRREKD